MPYNRLKVVLFVLTFSLLVYSIYNTVTIPLFNELRNQQERILKDEVVSSGIEYIEKRVRNFGNTPNRTQYVNILKADVTNPGVSIVTSKALDSIAAREPIVNQAEQERIRGREVVAGINGDMFNMQTGLNNGLQIKEGHLVINHNADQVKLFPVIGVDSAKKVFIDTLSIEGQVVSDGISIQIDSLNRNENANDKIAIYTQDINVSNTLLFDDRYDVFTKNGAVAVVSGVQDANELKAGKTYQGQVDVLYTSTKQGIQIPKNAIIIAGFGTKADWVRNNLKQRNTISFTFNVYKGAHRILANDVVEAVSSYNWLVQDNHALNEQEMLDRGYDKQLVSTSNARTAVGITADHKIIAVTVDKTNAYFSESMGVTLPELANILHNEGAVQAIGMDGGGSTEMIIRQKKRGLVTVNHPEGGSSSPVTNGLLFLQTFP